MTSAAKWAGRRVVNSVIADSATLYSGSHIVNSSVGERAFVGDGSKVDGSQLDSFARVGRWSHLYCSHLGRHTYTGQSTVVMHSTIGSFSSISWGVTIGGGEHSVELVTTHCFLYNDFDDLNSDRVAYDRFLEPCVVGNDVWIGAGATVLRGVTIGDGAVIGAGSVVTKSVPPYAIVAGNPARLIKYRFASETIEALLSTQWWSLPDHAIRENFPLFAARPTPEVLTRINELGWNRLRRDGQNE